MVQIYLNIFNTFWRRNFFFAYKIFIFSDAMDAVGKFKLQYAIKLKNFILQKIILNILQT